MELAWTPRLSDEAARDGSANMATYRVRVQLVSWYDIAVKAPSADDAVDRAEDLRPAELRARGERVREETGLADPKSVTPR
jgi:hypothetical protein